MNANVDLTNIVLETDRLILRAWKETDLTDFVTIQNQLYSKMKSG